MTKFAILTIGFKPPSKEDMQKWMAWFQSIQGQTISQIGFMNGISLSEEGQKELVMDKEALTGMLTVEAENMEQALEMAKGAPIVTETRVYQLR